MTSKWQSRDGPADEGPGVHTPSTHFLTLRGVESCGRGPSLDGSGAFTLLVTHTARLWVAPPASPELFAECPAVKTF